MCKFLDKPLPWDDKGIVFKTITAERFSKNKKHEKMSISDEKKDMQNINSCKLIELLIN